jgi:phage shock protein PspC (stress-responsive transcriptional regulator)
MLLADYALNVTLVQLFIWVVLFPVLVQGLIIYAIAQARGEKRQNDEFKRAHE